MSDISINDLMGFFAGDIHVQKRDTGQQVQQVYRQHHLSKAILLHALGNAAMLRSKRYLFKHVQPNRGHHLWRRAAAEALRHYSCKEVRIRVIPVFSANSGTESESHISRTSCNRCCLHLRLGATDFCFTLKTTTTTTTKPTTYAGMS